MKTILGLDASTTTVGVGIINIDEQDVSFVHSEYFKPPKKDEFERLIKTKEYISEIIDQYKPDYIGIEDYTRFMKKKSRAATIISLAILNRTLCLHILETTANVPFICNVNSIRAKLKLDKERPKKEDMPEVVTKHLNIEYPWIEKINKKTKLSKIAEESYDVADAIAVALYVAKFKI